MPEWTSLVHAPRELGCCALNHTVCQWISLMNRCSVFFFFLQFSFCITPWFFKDVYPLISVARGVSFMFYLWHVGEMSNKPEKHPERAKNAAASKVVWTVASNASSSQICLNRFSHFFSFLKHNPPTWLKKRARITFTRGRLEICQMCIDTPSCTRPQVNPKKTEKKKKMESQTKQMKFCPTGVPTSRSAK